MSEQYSNYNFTNGLPSEEQVASHNGSWVIRVTYPSGNGCAVTTTDPLSVPRALRDSISDAASILGYQGFSADELKLGYVAVDENGNQVGTKTEQSSDLGAGLDGLSDIELVQQFVRNLAGKIEEQENQSSSVADQFVDRMFQEHGDMFTLVDTRQDQTTKQRKDELLQEIDILKSVIGISTQALRQVSANIDTGEENVRRGQELLDARKAQLNSLKENFAEADRQRTELLGELRQRQEELRSL